MRSGVFIAMPVYRGGDVIEETIRSILAQTHSDFHLVMSVDGADDPTIEVCRKYADDSRIDVVVQENRLGWPGNFNWLIENCDREFFCYWQQDDLASTGYLESLRRELLARSDAAIAYTDVQWFGARFDRNGSPSIEGDPLSRVMQHIEAIRYEPLRGLMRSSMLPQGVAAIPVTEDESCQEEFVFLTHMAAAGAFVRIDTAMYFKRLHTDNAFVRWAHFPDWRRRRGWLSMGAGMYRIARQHAGPEIWPHIVAQVADRLAIERHGRSHFYSPPQTSAELTRFVHDFAALAELLADDLGLPVLRSGPLERPVHREVLAALQIERDSTTERERLADDLERDGRLELTVRDNPESVTALLGFGWSRPEPWGIWTDGKTASIRIPAFPGRAWRASLEGRTYDGNGTGSVIGAGPSEGSLSYKRAKSGLQLQLVVESPSGGDDMRLAIPNASSPSEDQVSGDTRHLGFGLQKLTIELT